MLDEALIHATLTLGVVVCSMMHWWNNTFIGQFPNSLWANFAGFHTNNAYFQASEGARTAPTVKF